MPLSEFLRLAIEKLEASKKKSCPTDHTVSGRENDFVEVLWKDSTPTYHSLSPNTPSVRDATLGNSTTECLGGVDSDVSPVVPSGDLDLSQKYGVDDGAQDYVKAKERWGSRGSSCDEAIRYLDNQLNDRSLCSWSPQQGQTSRINRQDAVFGNGFSKHAAFVKANPIAGGISSPGVKRMKLKEADPACRCSMQRLTSKQKDIDPYVPFTPIETGKALMRNTFLDGDRSVKPVLDSSSVGSGNSGGRVPYEETHNLKRKLCDIESEFHNDDIQIESAGVKKVTATRGDSTGARKSRTAQVHNLSERRRRDRINEKMRALQQLIPNCNKADKASMLDDAIQYLKNLQHQLQTYKTMSIGAGLCVQPMMIAPGSQPMYPAHIPHYSSMGVGMGMSYPIFPVNANFQGTPPPNLPIHRQLCPGLHSTLPRPPSVPPTGAHHTSLNIPTTSLNLNSEDPVKSTKPEASRQ